MISEIVLPLKNSSALSARAGTGAASRSAIDALTNRGLAILLPTSSCASMSREEYNIRQPAHAASNRRTTKTHAEFGPLHGAALQQLIVDTRNVPPAALERARASVRR